MRIQNYLLFLTALVIWIFFFVPNPAFHFLNIHGLDSRLSTVVLFVVVPIVLSLALALLMIGPLSIRITSSLLVPIVGVLLCLTFWLTGIYTDEGLMGAWLNVLPPIVAYVVGVVCSIFVIQRRAQADTTIANTE